MTVARSPQACALSGFPAHARVVGEHVNGDYAAVYVVTHETDDRGDWVSLMHRTPTGWEEVAGGDGGQIWVLPADAEEDQEGVLVIAHPVDQSGTYRVWAREREVMVNVQGSDLLAVLVGVGSDDWPSTELQGD